MHLGGFLDLTPSQIHAVEAIYLKAFPARERMPFEEIAKDVSEGRRIAYVAIDEDVALGFASAYVLKSVQTLFLEYIAISEERRGAGLGGELWDYLRNEARTHHGVSGIVLEVENPDEPGIDPGEAIERRRRIRFYATRDAYMLPVSNYRVPYLQDEGDQLMLLMWSPAARSQPPAGDELEELVRTLYLEGYDLPLDHPLVTAATAR
jgi:ribosomal protein S18 acetylase RimI-like enzyme